MLDGVIMVLRRKTKRLRSVRLSARFGSSAGHPIGNSACKHEHNGGGKRQLKISSFPATERYQSGMVSVFSLAVSTELDLREFSGE